MLLTRDEARGGDYNAYLVPSERPVLRTSVIATITPLPPSVLLFGTVCGVGVVLGWCRKQKAQAVA